MNFEFRILVQLTRKIKNPFKSSFSCIFIQNSAIIYVENDRLELQSDANPIWKFNRFSIAWNWRQKRIISLSFVPRMKPKFKNSHSNSTHVTSGGSLGYIFAPKLTHRTQAHPTVLSFRSTKRKISEFFCFYFLTKNRRKTIFNLKIAKIRLAFCLLFGVVVAFGAVHLATSIV